MIYLDGIYSNLIFFSVEYSGLLTENILEILKVGMLVTSLCSTSFLAY